MTALYPRFVDACQTLCACDIHESGATVKNQGLTIAPMDYKKEIGRRIKESRAEKGWSLAELSRRTKDVLSDTRISNYETGERMPGPADAVILASALGKRPAYLMAVDDVQLPISEQEENLIRNWRVLPENERMSFFRKVEQLAMAFRDPVSDKRVERHIPALQPRQSAAKTRRKVRT